MSDDLVIGKVRLIGLARLDPGEPIKNLANVKQEAFDWGMREVRLIPAVLFAVALLTAGCGSLRPPAQEQAVRESERQQSQASPQQREAEDWLYWIAYNAGSVSVH